MPLNPIRHITFDAHDPHKLARFWGAVLALQPHPGVTMADPEGNEFCVERSATERDVVA